MSRPAPKRTLLDKLWEAHQVRAETAETPALLYIDLHLIHEVTSPQAFSLLRERGLSVRCPERTVATLDHIVPTTPLEPGTARAVTDPAAVELVRRLETSCRQAGVRLYDLADPDQGIVHLIAPEQGFTQPGMTVVCGDSHTSTHGAFGALAFGIGTSEVGHVLATQCLLQRKPKSFSVRVDGRLPRAVTAKDLILALIARIGVGGGTGHLIEYSGEAIRALSMEERMTVCNMSIEAGARSGLVGPDETTFAYLTDRPASPTGTNWPAAVERWRHLVADEGASYDKTISFDASALEPMITFGTDPSMAIPISAAVPEPGSNPSLTKALAYMKLTPGKPLLGHPVDVVFIGSCTNGRLSDLRQAAALLRGRKVAAGLRVLVVPGSQAVKRQAEAEQLDDVFRQAGAEWREPGCSLCIAMNGDQLEPGQACVSTSNRNFEGRQGAGSRTFLASPATAAAAAVAGYISDPREWMEQ